MAADVVERRFKPTLSVKRTRIDDEIKYYDNLNIWTTVALKPQAAAQLKAYLRLRLLLRAKPCYFVRAV